MNLLIVNGYDKNGWAKLAKYKLQPICEFYRDQLKFINPKKSGELALDDVCTVVIDVAEQEIERPVKKQRSYYSGKKNGTL